MLYFTSFELVKQGQGTIIYIHFIFIDMSGEFVNDRPKYFIEESELTGEAAKAYGIFAYRLVRRVRHSMRSFPSDFLLVGDNWYQVLTINPFEVYQQDIEYQGPDHHTLSPILMRRCYSRRPHGTLLHDPVMELLEEADSQASDDEQLTRIAESLGVVDFTSVGFPAFPDPDQLCKLKSFPWGRKIKYGPYKTEIYHIDNLNFPEKENQ